MGKYFNVSISFSFLLSEFLKQKIPVIHPLFISTKGIIAVE